MKTLLDEKLLKFISVGILNTVLGMAIMFGMYNLLGCSYWLSSATNYVLVSILSYCLNKYFTFGHKGHVASSGLKFIINIGVCYFIAYGVAKPMAKILLSDWSLQSQENIALALGMCVFTGLNYIGQRFFVFREDSMKLIDTYNKWIGSIYLSEEEKATLGKMTEEDIYEAFYKHVEFGTAGMRGIMGLGTNRINKYTIRMAAKGLAEMLGTDSKVVVAYDTRNNSKEFAAETAKVLAAAGVKVFVFDRYSPVPLLSYAVRRLGCDGGVVITASHNTSEYNGFKVYDNTGCQMNEEMAGKIAANIEALEDGLAVDTVDMTHENITFVGEEIIEGFKKATLECGDDIDRDTAKNLKIVYTPLHGSGRDYVLDVLNIAGFENITLVEEQAQFNGDFPTVKKPNPEDKEAFTIAEQIAKEVNADIIIGTDPDCDRIGVGVITEGGIEYITGNQIGVLLIDYLARTTNPEGKKMITTIVTGEMGGVVAESYGVDVIKTFTGFKNIGAVMNGMEDDKYFFGYEESYGYLPGVHARDKDGVSAAITICKMAAYWKTQGKSLKDILDELYAKFGYWIDRQQSFEFEGSAGEKRIADIMASFREKGECAFQSIMKTNAFLDYKKGIDGYPPANVLKYTFEGGSWIAVRPSGTEPKIKMYYCINGADKEAAEETYKKFEGRIKDIVDGR